MNFLRKVQSLPAKLVMGTGTYINFLTSQLEYLPLSSTDVSVELPDGTTVSGRYTRNVRNPYIGGTKLVRWIRSVHPGGSPIHVTVLRRPGSKIVLAMSTTGGLSSKTNLRRRLQALASLPPKERARKLHETWERDPRFRELALQAWGPSCQVIGCKTNTGLLKRHASAYATVHHIESVAGGGSDELINACIVCANHHNIFHRAGGMKPKTISASEVEITAGSAVFTIERDLTKLL